MAKQFVTYTPNQHISFQPVKQLQEMAGVSGRPTDGACHHCGFILHNLYKEHTKTNSKYLLQSKTASSNFQSLRRLVVNFDQKTVIGVLNTAEVGNILVSEMKFKIRDKE